MDEVVEIRYVHFTLASLMTEIGRTAAQDISTDAFLPSLSDTKLVWYFLKNGFVKSPLLVHLPQQFRQRPPDDTLPGGYDANPKPVSRNMSEVLAETIRLLTGRSKRETVQETPPVPVEESIDSSVDMSTIEDSGVIPSSPEIPSSPDTVSHKPYIKEEPEDPEEPRVLELEPWVWANTLITSLKALVKSRDVGAESLTGWRSIEGALVDTRIVDGREMTATILPGQEIRKFYLVTKLISVYILVDKNQCTKIALPGMKVLAISFFDDIELAVLLEFEGGVRVLSTLTYAGREFEKIEVITELSTLPLVWYGTVSCSISTVETRADDSPHTHLPRHHRNSTTSRLYLQQKRDGQV